ncbi:ABC transporter substrate-binding protein [Okibacterium endophyticum]
MSALLRRSLSVAAAGALTLFAASCASAPGSAEPTPDPSEPAAYPLVLDNCGTEVTFEKAPQRVVTIKSATTELLVALGLADRIVGQGFPDGAIPEQIAGRPTGDVDIPVISDTVPGQEAVLDLEPDMVFGGWESNFSADGVGDRGTLAALGVTGYVAPSACKEPGYQPDPLTFDDVFTHIEEAGAIFDVADTAETLVDEQRAVLAGIEPVSDVTALWWSSGGDSPYVGGGIGAPQMIMDAVGLTNIAASIQDTWGAANWESVVDANPDVLVLVDAAWNPADTKIESLRSNPATAQLDAVVNERFIVVPFASTEAGVRNADAAAAIAAQLEDLGY